MIVSSSATRSLTRRTRVPEPDAAEVEARLDHVVPEAEERRRDAQLDPGLRVPRREVAELDELERVDRLGGDPEAVVSTTNVSSGRR